MNSCPYLKGKYSPVFIVHRLAIDQIGLALSGFSEWTYPVNAAEIADRMGFAAGELILEVGHDQDCDADLRDAIIAKVGSPLLGSDSDEVVDGVLLWFRDDDGDLVDELVDALTYLSETGPIWLLTPKVGVEGHLDAVDIQDAAPTAGLTQTVSFLASANWSATRLVARKNSSGKK